MGLCKCPQRKVTNIFCYEHRVNVCEHCLVQNHPQCVVDTYRNWITDSVYSTTCGLCSEELGKSETIRLLCLHIVHWDCLDTWARSLPLTTAPAGYTCPICKKMCLFPAVNQVSPIADGIRLKMGEVNWARAGLGLPLLDQDAEPKKSLYNGNNNQLNHINEFNRNTFDGDSSALGNHSTHHSVVAPELHSHSLQQHDSAGVGKSSFAYNQLQQNYSTSTPLPNSHYNSSNSIVGSSLESSSSARKGTLRTDFTTPLLMDEDDNKYRRRSPFESLSRWLRAYAPGARRNSRRKTALYVVVGIVVLLIIFMLLFGRSSHESIDDNFNPHANPNIIIGHGKGIQHESEVET